MGSHYYIEYGGGLGDIFLQIYENGSYGLLDELGLEDRATVALITHNPFAREIFDFHPRAKQIDVKLCGYWQPSSDAAMRSAHGLPGSPPALPASRRPVEFYPAADDFKLLNSLAGRRYIVFAVSAGLPDRDFPPELVEELAARAEANSLVPVFAGRNYQRFDRCEYRSARPGAVDAVDKLTVPGVARLVRDAAAVVCCHSAVNILAWLMRKPQLLLYPQSVYERHIAPRDRWAFGADFPECRHAPFDSGGAPAKIDEFFDMITTSEGSQLALQDFPDFVTKVIAGAEPMAQNASGENLGFGWIYYGLIRNLQPAFVVAIGSARGFMPFCAARAARDNGSGQVLFIDPSYSGNGHPGWGGGGWWSDAGAVRARIADFGLEGWITHLKMTSAEAFPLVRETVGARGVGIVLIDGAHTYEHSLQDFDLYASLIREGFAVFHDSTSGDCEVWRTIHNLKTRGYPMITFHREVGLTVVEVRRSAPVEDTWKYLCARSNRAEKILAVAGSAIRPGDRLFDVYCGFSPLASLAAGIDIFGCDCDPLIVGALRNTYPLHRWEQIDEMYLPFADLPAAIDVLAGLGVSRGYAPWDPQRVVENVRYLLGRYYPRACVFETAAEYYGGEILDDIALCLTKLGYRCRGETIETDMASFHRRRVIVAER